MDPDFSIETPRLRLVYPRPEDDAHCDFFVRLYNTPEFIASNGGKPTQVTTREAARNFIPKRFVSEHERHGYGTYMIVLKPESSIAEFNYTMKAHVNGKETVDAATSTAIAKQGKNLGAFVGTVSLSNGATPEISYAAPDLGFAVLPEYCRMGIATEASWAVMRYAAEEKGVCVFLGLHNPANQASAGIFRNLGFSQHGKRVLKIVGGAVGMVWAGRLGDNGGEFVGLSEEEIRELGLPGIEGGQ